MAKKQNRQAKPTKAARITALLLRNNGATITDLAKATGWQAHSLRGFMSGALKKVGSKITSKSDVGKPRRYFLVRGAS